LLGFSWTARAKSSSAADDAYIEGAREIQRKNLAAAELDFARAVQLNPNNRDYALALLATRENHITELVQSAARARQVGDRAQADALIAQARALDPDNPILAQHLGDDEVKSIRSPTRSPARSSSPPRPARTIFTSPAMRRAFCARSTAPTA
jgi:tetratricopeptide (TPR) repeat protein